jgi:FKBP-type peptidyl-prolyl cis-trans isomerase FkpA
MNRRISLLLALLVFSGLAAAAEEAPAGQTIDPLANNKAKSAEFFAKLDAEPGVKKLPSGLRIRMTQEGDGPSPASTDMVRVHYRGTFLDGKEFDSSYKRGKPAQFSLMQVVACWTEGLQLIKTGGKATLWCPSEIAYGDSGRGPIPPGATLQFEVELVEITGGAAAVKP